MPSNRINYLAIKFQFVFTSEFFPLCYEAYYAFLCEIHAHLTVSFYARTVEYILYTAALRNFLRRNVQYITI